MEFEKGQLIGIAGANGSGKSTLLSILTKTILPSSGNLILDEKDILNDKKIQIPFSFVPQKNNLFEDLSVRDNLLFWSKAYKADTHFITKFFSNEELSKKTKFLSGGKQKLLSINIGLLQNPDYFFMDEPTSSLDIVYQQEILEILLELKKEKCVIITSHYFEELYACDNIYILKNGTQRFNGNPKNFSSKDDFNNNLISFIKTVKT